MSESPTWLKSKNVIEEINLLEGEPVSILFGLQITKGPHFDFTHN